MGAWLLIALVAALGFLGMSWLIMVLVDPATSGAYTISYGQALAVTGLLAIVSQFFQPREWDL